MRPFGATAIEEEESTMDLGEEKPPYVLEPLDDPVPTEAPDEPTHTDEPLPAEVCP
jgi:hypothetical protein